MSKVSASRKADQPAAALTLEQRVEQLDAVVFVLTDRIATLERSNVETRAALGLSAPPPPLGGHWHTVKDVAFDTRYSEGGVWGWVRKGKVQTMKVGGHVYINTETLPEKIKKRAACFSKCG